MQCVLFIKDILYIIFEQIKVSDNGSGTEYELSF